MLASPHIPSNDWTRSVRDEPDFGDAVGVCRGWPRLKSKSARASPWSVPRVRSGGVREKPLRRLFFFNRSPGSVDPATYERTP